MTPSPLLVRWSRLKKKRIQVASADSFALWRFSLTDGHESWSIVNPRPGGESIRKRATAKQNSASLGVPRHLRHHPTRCRLTGRPLPNIIFPAFLAYLIGTSERRFRMLRMAKIGLLA